MRAKSTVAAATSVLSLLSITALNSSPAGAASTAFPSAEQVVSVDSDRLPLRGDFDGDGRGDLIWYSGRPDADGVWYGRADGGADPTVLGAGPGFSPFVGDFNGDNIDDVFWYNANQTAPGIVWFGTRGRAWAYSVVPAPPAQSAPVVSDLDGNGGDDIYFDNPAGDDALFTANGATFTVEPAYVAPGYAAATGDFDGNGAGDAVLYNPSDGLAILWWGSRGGRSGGVVYVGPGFTLRSGDFNGDKVDDLLWYAPGDAPDAVLYGQRNQRFLGAPVSAGGDFTPVVGDFDGDGRDDVLWNQPQREEDLIWFFRSTRIDGLDVSSTVAGTPTVVDFNGDKSDDLLYFTPGSGFATFWFGGLRTAGANAPQLNVQTLVGGLTNPWDLEFTPDGTILFTERPGLLAVRLTDGTVRTVAADLSDLYVLGEIGLLGLAVDPGFASNRRFYTCQGVAGANPSVKVVAWQMAADYSSAVRTNDPLVGDIAGVYARHGGCRLRFDPSGALLIGTGDAAVGTNPQDLTALGGKVLRVDASNGSPAAGNPFLSSDNAKTRLIYTYGHRNVQGLAVRPGSGQIFEIEHGPDRDDEVNVLQGGANYGWNPVPGYNEAVPMTASGATASQWSSGFPTVAPSGATFLTGAAWRGFNGALAVVTLKGTALRVQFYDAAGGFTGEVLPAALSGTHGRLRSAVQGPDGALYITTDNGGTADEILRVSPS